MEKTELTFEVSNAELTRKTRKEGNMDPYCLVQIGRQTFETKVCKGGDVNPSWKQKFTAVIDTETEINVEVWDVGPSGHMLIADGKVSIHDLRKTGAKTLWINLINSKRGAGKILLQLEWNAPKPKPVKKKEMKDEEDLLKSMVDSAQRLPRREMSTQTYPKDDKGVQCNTFELWEELLFGTDQPKTKPVRWESAPKLRERIDRRTEPRLLRIPDDTPEKKPNLSRLQWGHKPISYFRDSSRVFESVFAKGIDELDRIKPKQPLVHLGNYLLKTDRELHLK